MRKTLYTVLLAALVLAVPASVAKAEADCETTGWWWFKQTTCIYPHGEGAIEIKTNYQGNVTSVRRLPY